MTTYEGRSEQRRSLASAPVAGVEPAALHTRYLRVVHEPPAHQRLSRHAQSEFSEWARGQADVATVADLAAIAAAEEAAENAVFPPSPALRVKWGRVAAWSVPVLLAGVTVARFVNEHRQLAFWTLAFSAAYVVHVAVERVRA